MLTKETWTKGAFARNRIKLHTDRMGPEACFWDIAGWLDRAKLTALEPVLTTIINEKWPWVVVPGHRTIVTFNDHPDVDWSMVEELFNDERVRDAITGAKVGT
jgi:hypothetical protein